jgi:hypothetical protein
MEGEGEGEGVDPAVVNLEGEALVEGDAALDDDAVPDTDGLTLRVLLAELVLLMLPLKDGDNVCVAEDVRLLDAEGVSEAEALVVLEGVALAVRLTLGVGVRDAVEVLDSDTVGVTVEDGVAAGEAVHVVEPEEDGEAVPTGPIVTFRTRSSTLELMIPVPPEPVPPNT